MRLSLRSFTPGPRNALWEVWVGCKIHAPLSAPPPGMLTFNEGGGVLSQGFSQKLCLDSAALQTGWPVPEGLLETISLLLWMNPE